MAHGEGLKANVRASERGRFEGHVSQYALRAAAAQSRRGLSAKLFVRTTQFDHDPTFFDSALLTASVMCTLLAYCG